MASARMMPQGRPHEIKRTQFGVTEVVIAFGACQQRKGGPAELDAAEPKREAPYRPFGLARYCIFLDLRGCIAQDLRGGRVASASLIHSAAISR
jgi:hypothetical protein